MMTFPGAPCIYYGDEIGMSAGDDPYCREAFPWHDDVRWNKSLQQHIKQCISLRHSLPVLRTGQYQSLWAERDVFGFRRFADEEEVVVFINRGTGRGPLPSHVIPNSEKGWQVVWEKNGPVDREFVAGHEFELAPQSAFVLRG